MHPDIRQAIESRISHGFDPAQVAAEFIQAGYAPELAYQYVQEVTGVTLQPVVSAEPSVSQSEAEALPPKQAVPAVQPEVVSPPVQELAEPSVQTEPDSSVSESPAKKKTFLWVGLLGAVLVVILGAVALLASSSSSSLLTGIFSSAPYETESEFMSGIAKAQGQRTAFAMEVDYRLAIDEPSADTLVFDADALPAGTEEIFSSLFSGAANEDFLLAQVDARFSVAGLVDIREEQNPKFDVVAAANILAEPLILNVGGSMRLVDRKVYGRIDELPANLRPMVPSDVPLDTWILMAEELDAEQFNGLNLPTPLLQVFDGLPKELAAYLPGMMAQYMQRQIAFSRTLPVDWRTSQMAQIAAPLMEQESAQLAELRASALALLEEYPVIRFTQAPVQVTWNEESVYQYQFDIDFQNLANYLFALQESATLESGGAEQMNELRAEVEEELRDIQPLLDEINRLTHLTYYVRTDGSVAGFTMDSNTAFDTPSFDRAFILALSSSFSEQNDGIQIDVPAAVHPESLEDMLSNDFGPAAPSFGQRTPVSDAVTQQTLSTIRSQAELSYNRNGFSYSAVCADTQVLGLLNTIAESSGSLGIVDDAVSSDLFVTCNTSADAYAVTAPLNRSDLLWCVDSTGRFEAVPEDALSSATDYRCVEEEL